MSWPSTTCADRPYSDEGWNVRRRVVSEDMIISSDELIRRDAAFAATGAIAGLPFPRREDLTRSEAAGDAD
jgi:hypothetical protein